jgi:outer membrane receptor protein involved in Fe transport
LAFANLSTDQKIEDSGVSAEATYDINDDLTLTSITAIRNYRLEQGQDSDFSTADIWGRNPDENSTEFNYYTQELRLAGATDRLDYLFGLFYSHEELDRNDSIRYGADFEPYFGPDLRRPDQRRAVPVRAEPAQHDGVGANPFGLPAAAGGALGARGGCSRSGRATRTPTRRRPTASRCSPTTTSASPTARADAGPALHRRGQVARHAVHQPARRAGLPGDPDPVHRGGPSRRPLLPLWAASARLPTSDPAFNNVQTRQERSEEELTGTLKAAYRFTDDVLTYASYARGYKAGGFNLDRSRLNFGVINETPASSRSSWTATSWARRPSSWTTACF